MRYFLPEIFENRLRYLNLIVVIYNNTDTITFFTFRITSYQIPTRSEVVLHQQITKLPLLFVVDQARWIDSVNC